MFFNISLIGSGGETVIFFKCNTTQALIVSVLVINHPLISAIQLFQTFYLYLHKSWINGNEAF